MKRLRKRDFRSWCVLYSNGTYRHNDLLFRVNSTIDRYEENGQRQQMYSYANASLKITIVISSASGIGLINLIPLLNRVFLNAQN